MCIPTKALVLLFQVISIATTIIFLYTNKEYISEQINLHPGTRPWNLFSVLFLFGWFMIVALFKVSMAHVDKDNRTAKREKCYRDLVFGYGGIAFLGVVPLMACLVTWWNPLIKYTIAITCNIAVFPVYLCFCLEHVGNYYYKETDETLLFKFRIIVSQFILVFITVMLTWLIVDMENATVVLKFFIYYAILFSPNLAELVAIQNFGLRVEEEYEDVRPPQSYDYRAHVMARRARIKGEQLEMVENGPHPDPSAPSDLQCSKATEIQDGPTVPVALEPTAPAVETPDDDPDDHPSSTALECNVCMLGYCSQVIPRILIGCGHTVCQGCVNNLMKEGTVVCPYCRKETTVPEGVARKLPKNYAIFEMIRERDGES